MQKIFNPLTGEFDFVGGGDENLAAAVAELQDEVFPLTVTLSKTGGTTVEYTASAVSTTLTWKATRKGVDKVPSSVKITQGSSVLLDTVPNSHTGTVSASVSSKGTTTFTLTVTADGMTKTATTTITRILPLYLGFSSKGTLNSIKANLTKYVKTTFDASMNITNSADGKYLVIALPDGKTIKSITSGGFDIPLSAVSADTSVKIGSTAQSYNVYYSVNPIAAGTMSNLKITI